MKKKSIEVFESILTSAIKYFKWIVIAAFAVILLTGVYNVGANEVALVLRFGALTGDTREEQIKGPGLHFTLPNFIDEVIKVPVETVQEMTVSTLYGTGSPVSDNVRSTGYAITGDSNVLLMRMAVKYRIGDPVAYALRLENCESILSGLITSEMTALTAKTSVDNVLTTEKSTICQRAMANVQAQLDSLGYGLIITNIELTGIAPPTEAKEAFDNATTASVRKETLIQQANDYRESALPQAQAQAQKLISDATANQAAAVAKATNAAEQLNGLYAQYEANPRVVTDGVFRSRLAAVLEKSGKTIVVPDGGGSRIILP